MRCTIIYSGLASMGQRGSAFEKHLNVSPLDANYLALIYMHSHRTACVRGS